jgi:hypothetical protein
MMSEKKQNEDAILCNQVCVPYSNIEIGYDLEVEQLSSYPILLFFFSKIRLNSAIKAM